MATPTTTIDALPPASSVNGTQLVIIQEAGVTKKASVDSIATYLEDHLSIPLTAAEISALANPNIAGTTVQSQLTDIIAKLSTVDTGSNVWLRWTGTQAEYDALGTYRTDTIYAITGAGGDPAGSLSAPQNVHALAGDTTVTVSWNAPASGTPTSYSIERSTVSNSGFVPVNLTPIPATTYSFLDAPLTNGVTYYYTVTAHDAGGNSTASVVVSVVPVSSAPTVPGVPTNVVAIAGPSSVTINWLAPISNGNSPITGYVVQQLISGTYTTVATVNGTTFSRLVSGLTNGTPYSFRVYAVNAVGNGAFSPVVTATPTTGATAPSAPTSPVATAGIAEVTVTWGVPASDGGAVLNTYLIERSTLPSSGFTVVGTNAAESPRTFTSTALTPGTTYYFRITAQNVIGTSPATAIVNAVPTAPVGPPPTDWATAFATRDLDIITAWYNTYTGYDSDSFAGTLWGPGQSNYAYIDAAWLTANTGPNVVFSAGRWTVTGFHAAAFVVRASNITFSHCFCDRLSGTVGHGLDLSGDVTGIIFDHCTIAGNYGISGEWGVTLDYFADNHAANSLIIRYCDISGYIAGCQMWFGTTLEYSWVHDLYITLESHNTAASIRGENCSIYRNLLTDGNSSAVSLYADSTPFTNFSLVENVMTTNNADYTINFGERDPDHWNRLYDPITGAPITSTYGFRRECLGNLMVPANVGLGSDMAYFTKVNDNRRLSDNSPTFFDEGGTPVATQPYFHKMRYNELGGGILDSMPTYEFTPTPNSTVLVFVGIVNGGHATTQAPTVTAIGQYPQTSFVKILETPFTSPPGDDNHGLGLFVYKAESGSTTSFEHIVVDPYVGPAAGYFTIWVYELTGMTGLSLAHSSAKAQSITSFGATLSSITSNNLSAAATTGRVCMAFAAGASTAPVGPNPYGNVTGWNKTGVQPTTMHSGFPFVTGAVYWRKDFTGTNITIPSLGVDTYSAGVLLAEFA